MEGILNGHVSKQRVLVADMPPKTSWQGQLTARHKDRGKEETPADTAVPAWQDWGLRLTCPLLHGRQHTEVLLEYTFATPTEICLLAPRM